MWLFQYIMINILISLTLTQENNTLTQKNTDITIIRGIFKKILKYLHNIGIILVNMIF